MFLFRKLIIAVLALGLVLSFGSMAFAENAANGRPLQPIYQTNPNAPLAGEELTPTPRNIPPFTKPASDLEIVSPSITIQTPNGDCSDIDYSGGSAYYYWDIPNVYGTTKYSQRFSPTGACTLTAAYIALDFDQTVGSPDLDLYIYSDDGFGYPDAEIDHITIPNASLPTTGQVYFGVTGLDYTFADGEDFHIAWGMTENAAGDKLVGFSDDGSAGETRSAEFWNAAWGFMEDNWSLDVNFLMTASVCYEETAGLPDECYDDQGSICNVAYIWDIPNVNSIPYYGEQFSVDEPETLKAVKVGIYDADPSSQVRILVCGKDGSGGPDTTNISYETTVDYADLTFYPDLLTIDVSALNIVYTSDFFVLVTLPAGDPGYVTLLTDDGTCPIGQGWAAYGSTLTWYNMGDLFGTYYNFYILVDYCVDYYASCDWLYNYDGLAYIWDYPDSYGQNAWASKFDASLGGCDMAEIDVYFYDNGNPYAYDAALVVYAADGANGLPGTVIYTYPLPVGSITPGAWNSFDVAGNVHFEDPVWVSVESYAPAASGDICLVSDDGSTPTGRLADGYPGGIWYYATDDGWSTDYDMALEAYVCCVPQGGHVCVAASEDWPTMGKTFTRDNYSLNGIGGMNTTDDARCYLTKDWDYVGPNWAQYNSPVISDGIMVIVMTDYIVGIDASTGAQVWPPIAADNIYFGGSSRATPTIYNGKIYVTGGDAPGFSQIDLYTGAIGWQRTLGNTAVYGPSVVLNVGGTDVIFVSDDYGSLYAFNISDGSDFYGSNPFFTGTGFAHKALTCDPDNNFLFYGVDAFAGQPNLYKIDAATGTVSLDFVNDGDGFQLTNLHSNEPGIEGVYSAMAFEDGFLYMQTAYDPQNQSPVTNGGLLYKINTADLTIEWVSDANGAVSGAPGGVTLDLGSVYYGGWSNWVNGGSFWGPTSYSKSSGAVNWTQTVTNPNEFQHALSAALLTCETVEDNAVPDWLIWGSNDWYVHFLETTLGEQVFHRRFYGGTALINAPIMNGEYLYLGSLDFLAAMKNQTTPRPRLELPDGMEVAVPVPFGLGPSVDVTFPGVITNNGCADLTINGITIDANDNGTFPLTSITSVNPNRNANMNAIADQMAGKYEAMVDVTVDNSLSELIKKDKASSMNRASFIPPVWINGVTSPTPGTIVPAGGVVDIVVNVDGTQLPRGYNAFYAYVDTDDPDYFLDYAYMDNSSDYGVPSVKLAVVGGCLPDSYNLTFGMGGANFMTDYNDTKIFHDVGVDPGIQIDGNNAAVYGADGYVFGYLDKYHSVMHWDDPWSNAEFEWNGILPDPYIDDDCNFIAGTALLAKMSTDNGATYTDIYGTILNYAYVDSVQDLRTPPGTFGDFSTWNWEYEWLSGGTYGEPPYSDSLTEGFAFRGLVAEYAVVDVPEFNNFVVTRHSLYSRYGNAIDGVYMGGIADFDVGDYSKNKAGYSSKYSASWMYDHTDLTLGWGFIKVPFGGDFAPMKNAICIDYSSWYFSPDPEFDSIYTFLADRNGLNDPWPVDADKRLWWTLGDVSMPAWDYDPMADKDDIPDSAFTEVGSVLFGFNSLTDATDEEEYGPTAIFVNKFCGFGRGDVNDDGNLNLVDIVYMNNAIFHGGNGPFPFEHLGDVNGDGAFDFLDILYMIDWYFHGGPAPVGEWALPRTTL